MSNAPLMPKATAVWLLDNTALSFDQVADFCKMHPLEIQAIADGDAAQGIKGSDPIAMGQLTRDEIGRGEADPEYRLKLQESKVRLPAPARKKGPRYTPVSRRHERPSAILWLVRNHPELKDAQIMRLVGTTKTTIASIRDRTHWNASQLTPMDPVTLGLCSQIDLDFEVSRAAKEKPVVEASSGATLLPASETTRKEEPVPEPVGSFSEKSREQADDAAVFAKLKQLGGGKKRRGGVVFSSALCATDKIHDARREYARRDFSFCDATACSVGPTTRGASTFAASPCRRLRSAPGDVLIGPDEKASRP